MTLIKKRSGVAAMAWAFRQWAKYASAHHAELTAEETTALKYKLREEAEARAQADRLLQVRPPEYSLWGTLSTRTAVL